MEEIKDWYYTIGPYVYGPVSRYDLVQLYYNHSVFNNTYVWRIGMVDWVPYSQSELMGSFLPPYYATPANIAYVNDIIIWTVAFMPLVSILVALVSFFIYGAAAFFAIYLFNTLYVILCITDERILRKTEYHTGGLFVMALIFIPAYLFMRANLAKRKKWPVAIWCITFAASIIVYVGELIGL